MEIVGWTILGLVAAECVVIIVLVARQSIRWMIDDGARELRAALDAQRAQIDALARRVEALADRPATSWR
ncbi:MAG: hypothetical protein ACRDHV_01270 [Actinomycetota bacterium]